MEEKLFFIFMCKPPALHTGTTEKTAVEANFFLKTNPDPSRRVL
jgi:hypothetical protein